MKKSYLKLVSIISVFCLIVVAVWFLFHKNSNSEIDSDKGMQRNYGASHITTKITRDGEVIVDDIDEIVPSKEELIKNLNDEGYTIRQFEFVFESDIKADRVYAEKDDLFIDICFGLEDEEADKAFELYESEYEKFFLMAKNLNYVYCISDKKTFEKAGFKSLANNGIQYIYE